MQQRKGRETSLITYRYQAVTPGGVKAKGVLEAENEYAAIEKIRDSYPIVTKITPVKNKKIDLLSLEIGKKALSTKALSIMCSQFTIILRSGVSVARCMEMVAEQTVDPKLKQMLIDAAKDVSEGNSIAESFRRNNDQLPITFVETIRAGEESGTLERSFEALEKYYARSYKTTQKVKQAMTYPIFVLIVAIIVLAIVMIKVIPTVSVAFRDLGGELPVITRMMIAGSNFSAQAWPFLLIGLIAVFAVLRLLIKTEEGKIFYHKTKLRLPVFGHIALMNGAAQFANTMATLLSTGVNAHRALDITAKVMDNYVLGLETAEMGERLEEGRTLASCMKQSKYFPKTLIEMSAIGEETGELDETMRTIGEYFDNEADYATTKALSRLEPTILVVMAIFAGFIVISIYLPMFTMYDLM